MATARQLDTSVPQAVPVVVTYCTYCTLCGMTIATGLMRGVDRTQAARFSFLLSVPAILGASLLQARKIESLPREHVVPMLVGVAVAAVTGWLALVVLLRVVRAGRLHWFTHYCRIAAALGVAYLWGMQ